MASVYLNGLQYPIFSLDTELSLKARLAAKMPNIPQIESANVVTTFLGSVASKTLLPSLILLEPIQDKGKEEKQIINNCVVEKAISTSLNKKKYKVMDFFTTIATELSKDSAGKTEVDNIIKMFELPGYQVFLMYVLYFYFNGIENFRSLHSNFDTNIRHLLITGIKNYFDLGSIDNIAITYGIESTNIKLLVETNIKHVEEDVKFFKLFDKYLPKEEAPEGSDIQISKTSLLVKFKIDGDIYDLFDKLITSRNIPYAQLGNFYKLIKSFKPPKEWLEIEYEDEVLVLYVLNRSIEPERNKIFPNTELYSPVFIVSSDFENTVKSNNDNQIIDIEMSIESKVNDELKEENLLNRIFSSFQEEIRVNKECSVKQLWIECDYLIPVNGIIEYPLFYDMIMNDPLVSKFFVINENSNIFRERGGIPVYFRYNRYVNPWDYLLFKIDIIKVGPKQQARAPDIFSAGKYPMAINASIRKVSNMKEAKRVKNIINSLLGYYYGNNVKLLS